MKKHISIYAAAVLALASVLTVGADEIEIKGVDAGRVTILCKAPLSWTFSADCRKLEPGLEVLRVRLSAPTAAVPPEFCVRVKFPAVDIPYLWKPEYSYDGTRPCWTSADCRPSETSFAWWTPVYCLHNGQERNRFTIATSECFRQVPFRPSLTEETLEGGLAFTFFRERQEPMTEYETEIRLDRRDIFYADAISSATSWILAARGERPCVAPPAAFQPLYSTWYSFHQNVFDKDIEAECAEAAKLGMKTLIVDDGWQTDDTSRGYAYCGDWQVSKRRFPNMREHVARVQAMGIKYMMWFSMPSVGVKSANYAKFKGKYLGKTSNEATLDPRFPEVRSFLASVYAQAAKDWGIDGFKLDFINSFCLWGKPDPAVEENYAGRDIRSIPEAIDALVAESVRQIKAVKPDALIEFRQTYMGPAVRKYGNMFRVADCCGMYAANRAGIASLRLTSGQQAVHSDMLAWHPSETPQQGALQILNSIFGTVQYSMMLRTVSDDHKRMIAHWIAFSQAHLDTLQRGKFRPHHPELGYPVLEGESDRERIFGVYSEGTVVNTGVLSKPVYIINATASDEVVLDVVGVPGPVAAFDTFGQPVPPPQVKTGLNAVRIPPSGYLKIGI